MRVLVCGGRTYENRAHLYRMLDLYNEALNATLVIHGGARGADSLAGSWALDREIPVLIYPARWSTEGKAAGPRRNQQMLDEGKPDVVIAFPGGNGTKDMVRRSREAGLPVISID